MLKLIFKLMTLLGAFWCTGCLSSCRSADFNEPLLAASPLVVNSPYLSAREAYAQALPLIEVWHPEARLFHLTVEWPSPGGRSPNWQLYFVAPDTGAGSQQLRVIQHGQRLSVAEVPPGQSQVMPTCWRDSDEILQRMQDLASRHQAVYRMRLFSNGIWEIIQGDSQWELSACSGLLVR